MNDDYNKMLDQLEAAGHGPYPRPVTTKAVALSELALPNKAVTWPALERAMILLLKPFGERIVALEAKVAELEQKRAEFSSLPPSPRASRAARESSHGRPVSLPANPRPRNGTARSQ
jgi:hypothetical protein